MNPAILSAQITLHIARANWWTAYATTPGNLKRVVRQGGSYSPLLTADELIADAMGTAETHLCNAQDAIDALAALNDPPRS